jgi:predicted lipid-binding transport protein (Tim44 family)
MKISSVIAVLAAALVLTVSMGEVQAKRMGGGQSAGKQSTNVSKREAAPAQNQQAKPNAAPAPAPAAPAAPAKKPWGAMLGGLAAGLGLAWLANSMGLGGAMGAIGNVIMFAMLAFAAVAVIGYFMRRKAANGQGQTASPFAFAGAGAGAAGSATPAAGGYKPENVGNDASARPWEQNQKQFETPATTAANGGSMIGSALGGSAAAPAASTGLEGHQAWGVPAGFDTDGFLAHAKRNFTTLQAAWDKSDINALRSMMSDEMVNEMRTQLAERDAHNSGKPNKTEVLTLEAKLLGIEEVGGEYLASVEFTGLISEEPGAGPNPFREVWNMSKPQNGSSGWVVAGIQALQ